MMPCSPIHRPKELYKPKVRNAPYSPIPVIPQLSVITFDDVPPGKPPPMNPPPTPIDLTNGESQYFNRSPPSNMGTTIPPSKNLGYDPIYHSERHHHHHHAHSRPQMDHPTWTSRGRFMDNYGTDHTTTNTHTATTHPIPIPPQPMYHGQQQQQQPYPNIPFPNVSTPTPGISCEITNLNNRTNTMGSTTCAIPVRGNYNNTPFRHHPNHHEEMGPPPQHQHYQSSPPEGMRPNIVPPNYSPPQGSTRMQQLPPPSTYETHYHPHNMAQPQSSPTEGSHTTSTTMIQQTVSTSPSSSPEQHQQNQLHSQQGILHHLLNDNIWQDMFKRLSRYKKNYGHCHVPIDYITDPQLGKWAKSIRTLDKYVLPSSIQSQLDSIHFYDPLPPDKDPNGKHSSHPHYPQRTFQRTSATLEKQWNDMFQRVIQFKETHGHCQVPFHYKEDPKLGYWVKNQRFKRDRLSKERYEKLQDIGFEWEVASKVQNQTWLDMFERLKKFEKVHKHCFVPSRYKEDPKLGSWVHRQRHLKDKLPADRRAKLDSIGFL